LKTGFEFQRHNSQGFAFQTNPSGQTTAVRMQQKDHTQQLKQGYRENKNQRMYIQMFLGDAVEVVFEGITTVLTNINCDTIPKAMYGL